MGFILESISDHIAVLTINRPEALNAFNDEVIHELHDALRRNIKNADVGVIIVTGAGEKAFIAGADIKKMQTMSSEEALAFGRLGQDLTLTVETSPKPVIAAVNGFALGGGCELSLACPIRIASENASFGLPEVSLGLIPGWGGTQRLPRIVGSGLAYEMIVTGKMISAEKALDRGLVNHVVPGEELLDKAKGMGKTILKNSPNAIIQAMACIHQGRGKTIDEGLEIEVNHFKGLFDTEETKEGLSAFVEKRKANFR